MARILVIDDEPGMLEVCREALERSGHEIETTGDATDGLRRAGTGGYDLVLTDLRMPETSGLDVLKALHERCPDTALLLMSAYATIPDAHAAGRTGAADILTKPFSIETLRTVVRQALETKRLEKENRQLKREAVRRYEAGSIVAESGAMQDVLAIARRAAESSATVLVRGESGTGKEVVARVVHESSKRKGGPFIKVNCAAIPEGLLESELFGHEKGAFTGAVKGKPGKFELAHEGSIFLDEIGDMPAALQAKLLRVLQDHEFERVGGTRPLRVDVRVIAATNRDLEAAIKTGQFRDDLYWRLNVVSVVIPPLRDRPADIPPLATRALKRGGRLTRATPEALKSLQAYAWPGNVRELENVIERASVLAPGPELRDEDLPPEVRAAGARRSATDEPLSPAADRTRRATASLEIPEAGISMDEMERQLLGKALKNAAGNQTKAAKLLGITRRQLGYRLRKFGLDAAAGREGEG